MGKARDDLVLAFRAQSGQNGADMRFWYYFWTANFVVAGLAFALITVIVLVRGSQDLREMFGRLSRLRKNPSKLSFRAERGISP